MAFKIKGRWKKSNLSPVYERQDGIRIHKFGLIRNKNNQIENIPIAMIRHFEMLTGGNRARACMLIANKFYPIKETNNETE